MKSISLIILTILGFALFLAGSFYVQIELNKLDILSEKSEQNNSHILDFKSIFVGEPDVSTGLISMTIEAGLLLVVGNFSKNRPGIFVGFLSQPFVYHNHTQDVQKEFSEDDFARANL